MTAIFGAQRRNGSAIEPDMFRLTQSLAPYGRDDVSDWVSGNVGLGRRLHRIVDEDRFDRQPITVASGRYVVAADVLLSERDDLIHQLGLGNGVEILSDAALVAEAIDRWNERAFDRIYGSFAIAAWDTQEGRWLLARDHLGLKPLFYFESPELFAVASMPAGLQALPDVPRATDPDSMARYLRLMDPAPGRTFFEAISRVQPGHFAVVSNSTATQHRYWRPDLSPLILPTHQDYVDQLSRQLDDAVRASLRGGGKRIAAHLSAGFDSTAVATTAARLMRDTGGSVTAYTAVPRPGYSRPDIRHNLGNEGELAALTASMHDNMEHVLVHAQQTPLANIDRAASAFGMPILNLCNLNWFDAINDRVRATGVKVLLSGSRGNASISESGVTALPELMRAGRFGRWFTIARGLVRNRRMRWRGVLWFTAAPWMPERLYAIGQKMTDRSGIEGHRYSGVRSAVWNETTSTVAASQKDADPMDMVLIDEDLERPNKTSLMGRLQSLNNDWGAFSKGMLAEWGIDFRDPTADRRLVEFSLRVPVEHLVHEGQPRAMLRQILADRAPAAVLDNHKKGLQATDWHESLQGARQEAADQIERIEMFDPTNEVIDVARLKQLLADWPEPGSDRWDDEGTEADYRYGLLRAISTASFMRKAAGSNY